MPSATDFIVSWEVRNVVSHFSWREQWRGCEENVDLIFCCRCIWRPINRVFDNTSTKSRTKRVWVIGSRHVGIFIAHDGEPDFDCSASLQYIYPDWFTSEGFSFMSEDILKAFVSGVKAHRAFLDDFEASFGDCMLNSESMLHCMRLDDCESTCEWRMRWRGVRRKD
jgi:hypothetical protein